MASKHRLARPYVDNLCPERCEVHTYTFPRLFLKTDLEHTSSITLMHTASSHDSTKGSNHIASAIVVEEESNQGPTPQFESSKEKASEAEVAVDEKSIL